MAADTPRYTPLASDVRAMKLKEEDSDVDMSRDGSASVVSPRQDDAAALPISGGRSTSGSPMAYGASTTAFKEQDVSDNITLKQEHEEFVGGDVTLKVEPGRPPKLARSNSHKIQKRAPQLYDDYEDKTAEATSTFEVMPACSYANKYLGATEHALECDCAEEWDHASQSNQACGEDSDCINRATKMECIGDCGCGTGCQNQRFQQQQYANVTVIKTVKKGYGLRTDTDLRPNDFIFEYIGEVIGENVFRRRMQQYDEEGIKHFYFMSLNKGEFVDATKRGNLGRFCNHSCNPNCYVDKWVVGDKLRMGIFAERKIKAGEELVFNYNVDRYGADPQPCYCGEPNCTGYIGGKTQTGRATKLSNTIIEALGIDDAEAWDTAVARKPRNKKKLGGEDDEEYVNNVEPRGLDEDGVNKVMSSLMQSKEKWIAVKLLTRIQRADDEKVRNRVVKFHGYRILKTALSNFIDDVNVCLQILDILDRMPRLTRNKIQDSKIEETVGTLVSADDERVSSHAKALLQTWGQLEMAYRIPRMKRDPNAVAADRKADRFQRRDQDDRRRSKSRERTKSPERIKAPTGPRINPASKFGNPRPGIRFRPPPPFGPLPPGWFEASAANGAVYYYNQSGTTTWQRPTMAAKAAPPPPPPKVVSDQQKLQDLINNIVASKKEPSAQTSATATPTDAVSKQLRKEDKWKSYPEEKQKKLYEGALQPHIMHVVGKYKSKLPKDDLKRWAKEFAKQMVDSDFRKKRVENPTKISDRKAKDIKKHAQAFFDKAVKKQGVANERKAEKRAAHLDATKAPSALSPSADLESPVVDDDNIVMSDNDNDPADADDDPDNLDSPAASSAKRPRPDDTDDADSSNINDDAESSTGKKQRLQTLDALQPPPPPPPPPPPATDDDDTHVPEPMQTATPPTTGSPDLDAAVSASAKSQLSIRNLGKNNAG